MTLQPGLWDAAPSPLQGCCAQSLGTTATVQAPDPALGQRTVTFVSVLGWVDLMRHVLSKFSALGSDAAILNHQHQTGIGQR